MEEMHFEEMEKREQITGSTSVNTIDLLRRDTAVDIIESDIVLADTYPAYYFAPVSQANTSKAPWVIMIHEWWGLNENIKDMWRVLASEGYQVVAVDLYDGVIAADSSQAARLVSTLDQQEANTIMAAAESYLRSMWAPKVWTLWRCFGWGQSLQYSMASDTLDATVLYYGRLVTDPTQLSQINGPVLGIFGATDTSIPVADVTLFDNLLTDLAIDHSVYTYDGAGHAFANPTWPNFNQAATIDAWIKTLDFLKTTLN